MARDKSKDSYTFSLQQLIRRNAKQKLGLERSIRSIDMVRAFKICIRNAIRLDGWEGEQETTVGDGESDDWPDDWPEELNRIKDDKSHPRYGIFWRCVRRYLSRLLRGDTPPPSPPLPPWRRGNDDDDDDDDKKYSYSWLLLLTDDLVDWGYNWNELKLLLNNLIRNNDDLIHIRIEGTVTSMIELDLIQKTKHGPRVGLINFTDGVNTRDPRIVFELQTHPGIDEDGNTVNPRREETYLYGLP